MDTKWSSGLEQDEEFQELKYWLCSTPFWPIQISDSAGRRFKLQAGSDSDLNPEQTPDT